MPAKLTHPEIVALLSKKFPDVELRSEYTGAMNPLHCRCRIHNIGFTSSWNNFQIQLTKGNHGKSLCPKCVDDRRLRGPRPGRCALRVTSKRTQAEVNAIVQERLNERFGKNILTLVGDFKDKKQNQFAHSCGEVRTGYLNNVLASVYPCSCIRTKALVPFANLSPEDISFMVRCYQDLNFSLEQIAALTLVSVSTIRVALKNAGAYGTLNTTNGRRRTLEGLKGSAKAGLRPYKQAANALTNRMYVAYSDVLDPKGRRGKDYHIDHQLSKHTGYTQYATPLDLRILCHPANLKLLSGSDNVRKGSKSTLSLPKLKRKIKEFESKHGKVHFPEHFDYEFTREKLGSTDGLRVLALDPGTANFGVFGGVIKGVKTVHGIKVLVSTMLKNPIRDLTKDFEGQRTAFLSEMQHLLDKVRPDVVVIERFQTRGLMGTTVELIGLMIGLIAGLCSTAEASYGKTIHVKPVTASQWKNCVNKAFDLHEFYEELGSKSLHHRLDALLMSLYAFPNPQPYAFLTVKRRAKVAKYIKDT